MNKISRFSAIGTLYLLSVFLLAACGGSGSNGGGVSYTVSVNRSVGGSTSFPVISVNNGDITSFTVTPDTGYSIDSVSGCGGLLSGSTYTTGAITADCSVNVSFVTVSYFVDTSAGSNGSISPANRSVIHGSTIDFTVTPDAGYSTDSVSGCGGTLSGATYTTGEIAADCTINANFSINSYLVDVSAGSNGSIGPENRSVNHGSSTTFTVVSDAGYSIDYVSGCGGSLVGNVYTTGVISAPCTVSANFKLNGDDGTSSLAFSGDEWFVNDGATGSGSEANPFGTIQEAIDIAQDGDGITILPGTYNESLSTRRDGTAQNPIVIQSKEGRGTVTITANGRVLSVGHAYNHFSQLIFSGQYGGSDLIKVRTSADGWLLRNSEVKESSRDCIDMDSPSNVVISYSTIHHCLNAAGGRTDAHGVVGASIQNFLLKDTEIHSFSGDAFQVDPGRTSPGWDDVVIDGCQFWLEPLPEAVNGFAAGIVPGENAVDTKVRTGYRPKMTITNSSFWGYKDGLISNMSALNLKQSVDVIVDGVTIFDSDIAFRLRYPAQVKITNAIVHSVQRAVRYEDNITEVLIWNSTFGKDIGAFFQKASSSATTFNIQNTLILANSFPIEVDSNQNLIVVDNDFQDVTANNYSLALHSLAIDSGVDLNVYADRFGVIRPLGGGVDMGAIESY